MIVALQGQTLLDWAALDVTFARSDLVVEGNQ